MSKKKNIHTHTHTQCFLIYTNEEGFILDCIDYNHISKSVLSQRFGRQHKHSVLDRSRVTTGIGSKGKNLTDPVTIIGRKWQWKFCFCVWTNAFRRIVAVTRLWTTVYILGFSGDLSESFDMVAANDSTVIPLSSIRCITDTFLRLLEGTEKWKSSNEYTPITYIRCFTYLIRTSLWICKLEFRVR
jgi:hypothetical protein